MPSIHDLDQCDEKANGRFSHDYLQAPRILTVMEEEGSIESGRKLLKLREPHTAISILTPEVMSDTFQPQQRVSWYKARAAMRSLNNSHLKVGMK